MVARLAEALFALINRVRVWHRLPTLPLRVVNLLLLRGTLRRLNLHDTQRGGFPKPEREVGPEVYRLGRTIDGSYNDLAVPAMGARGMRFGRNSPIDKLKIPTAYDIMEPNPREISRRLLARRNGEFHAVPYLNILAAAWLQFMTHDWFGHLRDDQNPHEIPLADDDDWPSPERRMQFGRSRPDKEAYADRGLPPAFTNTESHWWDSGQIYGKDEVRQDELRTHKEGKLKVGSNGRLEPDGSGLELTGVNDNWWIGLSLLHTLFTREHNAICDRLLAAYPSRRNDDEWLYQKARLVNIAVIAKIHTVEWTPSLLNNPTMRFAMRANWWGAFGETFYRERGRVTQGEMMQGIPGSTTDHHTAPYSLTEEFVAVYRMHPLMPDVFEFRSVNDDSPIPGAEALDFRAISGKRTVNLYSRMALADAAYSLGTRNPGQVRLRNYPSGLAHFERQDSVSGTAEQRFLRPRHRRRRARPRARHPALQRLPPHAADASLRYDRGDHLQQGMGGGDQRNLRRRSGAGRYDRRAPLRRPAGGLWVLRHRLSHFHPDGVASAEERPLLHRRLHAGNVYAGRHGLDQSHLHDGRTAAPAARA